MNMINSKGEGKNVSEKVFEIGAEGGGIIIFRQREGSTVKFKLNHDEFDPTDEGLEVNIKKVYKTFEEAFKYIDSQYPWYSLYIIFVHEDFKDFIIKRLNEILIEKTTSTDESDYNRIDDIPRIQENLIRSLSEWDKNWY